MHNYSDVVITYDLHSNSGAIKLNQTGGMLKHLRTGRLVVVLKIYALWIIGEAWSLREVWLQVLHGVGSQSAKAAGAIIQASTLVTLFHRSWYRITSVISNACASSVQATFCSLLLDNEALTPKAATIKSTNLLCGVYSCYKRSARTSR